MNYKTITIVLIIMALLLINTITLVSVLNIKKTQNLNTANSKSASNIDISHEQNSNGAETDYKSLFEGIQAELDMKVVMPTYVYLGKELAPSKITIKHAQPEYYTVDYYEYSLDPDEVKSALNNESMACRRITLYGIYDPESKWLGIDATFIKKVELKSKTAFVHKSGGTNQETHFYPVIVWHQDDCTYSLSAQLPLEEAQAPPIEDQENDYIEKLLKMIDKMKAIK